MAIFGSSFSASFSLEEFVGHGSLHTILPALLQEGWDDVPTLKMMSSQDMEAQKLTQQQRDALEIRIYLHDRSLMQYADTLEASGKALPELLATSPAILSSRYSMKRGHVARFIDRTVSCGLVVPPALMSATPARRRPQTASANTISRVPGPHEEPEQEQEQEESVYMTSPLSSSLEPAHPDTYADTLTPEGHETRVTNDEEARHLIGETKQSPQKKKKHVSAETETETERPYKPLLAGGPFKGIVSAGPANPKMCGLLKPSRVADDVISVSLLEKISVQKLAPEYRVGVDPWGKTDVRAPPPMKASDIWATKATIIYCIRRPGCVMCRAEAHKLYSRKPIFDALGVQLVAVLHEHINSEVRFFWPRFWGGMIVVDKNCDFFKALGGGKLPTDNYITGLLFNSVARQNLKRARESGIHNNLHGNGLVKGGLLVVRPGKGGVAYQFAERNIGDWAPIEEVLDVCARLNSIDQGRKDGS